MGAWNWRTNGLLHLRLIRRWIAVCNSLGAPLALLVRCGYGCGCGCALGDAALTCVRVCACVMGACVCLGVGANLYVL